MVNNIDLSINFCGVNFKNPFLLSSSPVSNSADMVARAFDAGWGGVVFKTLNSDRLPIIHPSPRMHCVHYGSKKEMAVQNVEMISDRPLKDNLAEYLYVKKTEPIYWSLIFHAPTCVLKEPVTRSGRLSSCWKDLPQRSKKRFPSR
ncbi:MAG: hypothetical protein P8X68_16295 [Desulfobacterales bacterium]